MPLFIQYTLSLLGFIFACAYGYGQWKQGKNQVRIDTITLLKSDVDTLKDKVIELTNQVDSLTKELRLKDEKLKEWLEIFQGRNTDMVDFIKMGNTYMEIGKPILAAITTDVLPVVKRLDTFLNKQQF
jgi:FtsZ-binding cell division protein ZapB